MMKINVKRILPILLVLMMCLIVLPGGVYADDAVIDINRNGSITVTKYATENSAMPGNPATGLGEQTIPGGYNTLDGATFVLFKIADKDAVKDYYNGTSTTSYTLDAGRFVYTNETTATYDRNPATHIGTQTTSGGKCKFDNLEVGIYVLKEITAPSQITVPLAKDSLISIPMVNTATSSNNGNAKWIYDVNVYPKNHESTGTVELTKQDQSGNSLDGVVFELYKKEFLENGSLATNWTQVKKTTNNNGTPTSLTLITDSTGKITLASLPAGLYGTQYKLVETSAPNGYIVNKTPLYFKVKNDNTIMWNANDGEIDGCNNKNTGVVGTSTQATAPKLTITLCNEIPSLIKQVHENAPGVNWVNYEQYRLDDEITYRIITYVPNNVAELGTYEIKDIPDSGITDSDSSVDYTVTYGDDPDTCNNTLDAKGYSREKIVADGSNGQGFKLTLTDAGKTTTKGKFIQIVYKAHMNANATIAGNGNGNIATLTYSKFIGGGDDKYTIKDEARVYTYQYQITKYKDSVADGNKASGVEFNLLYAADGIAIDVYKENDGEYRLWLASSDTDTTKKTTTLVTKADGTILIKGLENGTYYLKETKTINGYNLLSEPFKIDLSVTETTNWTSGTGFTTTGKVVKTYGSTGYNVTDAKGTSTIINKKGFVLPQTGGMGYLLFCAVGILLIGGGAALIFGGRRKKIR